MKERSKLFGGVLRAKPVPATTLSRTHRMKKRWRDAKELEGGGAEVTCPFSVST